MPTTSTHKDRTKGSRKRARYYSLESLLSNPHTKRETILDTEHLIYSYTREEEQEEGIASEMLIHRASVATGKELAPSNWLEGIPSGSNTTVANGVSSN